MPRLMRCMYCGLLQDEPRGVKACERCGGSLVFEPSDAGRSYVRAQLELDQIEAPADQIVERHLVLTIETPPEVPADEAAPTPAGREPIAFCAVLDISGSMRGRKLASAKDAVRQSIRRLRAGDMFSLVTFATDVETRLEAVGVEPGLGRRVNSVLGRIHAGGTTALYGGLEAGIGATMGEPKETNLVLVLSDGQANEGETDLEQIGRRASEARQQGVTTSTLGVGSDYNEALMVEIAVQGGGRYYHVMQASQIAPYVAGELGEAAALAAHGATLKLDLPGGTMVQTFSSAYKVHSTSEVYIGDIPIDTQLEVVLRVLLPARTRGTRLPITGSLTYTSPAGSELTTTLNTVTLRVTAFGEFGPRDGAVVPVVRRVLDQMSARTVLGTSRLAAIRGQGIAQQRWHEDAAEIKHYASLLGDEAEVQSFMAEADLQAPAFLRKPAAAKAASAYAFRRLRATKDFDKA